MLLGNDIRKFSIHSKIDVIYKDLEYMTETASYRVYEAQTRDTEEKHSIRILDPTKDLVINNFDSAATLFIQELFHLNARCPGSVLINTLAISEARKQIVCAIRNYKPITRTQVEEIQGSIIDLKNPKVIEKMLNDVISDVEFLYRDLKIKNIASILEPENIYYLREKEVFFLGNWDRILEASPAKHQDQMTTVFGSTGPKLQSQDIAAEMRALAFALLKITKVDIEEIEFLKSSKKVPSIYDSVVKSIIEKNFSESQKLQNLIGRILSSDPVNLPNLEELKIKEDHVQVQVPFQKDSKDQKQDSSKTSYLELELEPNKEDSKNQEQLKDNKKKMSNIVISDSQKINIGDTAINPSFQWIQVQNPEGQKSGNSFHAFGQSAAIHKGATLTVVAVNDDSVLVSYQSPNGQGYGSEAGNGVLFFLPKGDFASLTQRYTQKQKKFEEKKDLVKSLLTKNLDQQVEESESNIRYESPKTKDQKPKANENCVIQ